MGIKSWVERKGAVGGTARAVAIAVLSTREARLVVLTLGLEEDLQDFGEFYIRKRYEWTNSEHLIESCLKFYRNYKPCPVNLAWAIVQNENQSNLDYVNSRKRDWIPMMREEITKLGVNPDHPFVPEKQNLFISEHDSVNRLGSNPASWKTQNNLESDFAYVGEVKNGMPNGWGGAFASSPANRQIWEDIARS